MIAERRSVYPVVDESDSVLGIVSLEHFRKRRQREAMTTREIMTETFPIVETKTPLFEVVREMNNMKADAAVVVADDEIVGILTAADLAATLRVRREAGAVVSPRTAL
jgi:predicted transcriptional regulator